MFGKGLDLSKNCAIMISDNITNIGDIMISLNYIVGLSTFYQSKNFQVNISCTCCSQLAILNWISTKIKPVLPLV